MLKKKKIQTVQLIYLEMTTEEPFGLKHITWKNKYLKCSVVLCHLGVY